MNIMEWNEYKRGETRERSDDITGGLMCTKAEVPTSAVTGRRASVPYVGHIWHMQLTNQAAWWRRVNPPLEVNLKLPVTANIPECAG